MTDNPPALPLAQSYHAILSAMIGRICADADGGLARAIDAVTDALCRGGLVHVAGSGHSHMLAEEVFYRAGGVAPAQAILDPDLMLHLGARRSTSAEREEGRAARVLARHSLAKGDVLFVASNSGRNAYPIELALEGRKHDLTVIAITSRVTAAAVTSRHSSGRLLTEVADIIIDNQAPVGDACLSLPARGASMAPVSTITGAFILNAILAEAVERAARAGIAVDVYGSANSPLAAAAPESVAEKWAGRIAGL
jgi:uncharacterized phosphosugar-binding protein